MSAPPLFAVVGLPVASSASPELWRAALAATGIRAHYTRLMADSAPEALELAHQLQIAGLNVTTPFKETLAQLTTTLHEPAATLGAVNTICRGAETFEGYNTDPEGVQHALRAAGAAVRGRMAVVVGAGGAARAAVVALAAEEAGEIVVSARRLERAEAVATLGGARPAPWEALAEMIERAAVVVVCLPPTAAPPKEVRFHPSQTVIDANYGRAPWFARAAAASARAHDGGAWLVAQAQASLALLVARTIPPRAPRALGAEVAGAMQRRMDAWATDGAARLWQRPIALTGMMGVGKTTIGRALAAVMGREFIDTDALVEQTTGLSIATLLAGDAQEFRRHEAAAVARALNPGEGGGKVVALGGGALMDRENAARVQDKAACIWLWAPLEVCLRRTTANPRPLLPPADPTEGARRLAERRAGYAATAELIVNAAASGGPEAIAHRIARELPRC